MHFGVTVAEVSPGKFDLLKGPGVPIHEQRENLQLLASKHGSGNIPVSIVQSNKRVTRCTLDLPGKGKKPATSKTVK